MLLEDNVLHIIPVVKYLKYLDNGEKSYNTQKTYRYTLKLYFEYFKDINIDYRQVNRNILSNFVRWLRNPYESVKAIKLRTTKARRIEKTVTTNFYGYLFRTEEIEMI